MKKKKESSTTTTTTSWTNGYLYILFFFGLNSIFSIRNDFFFLSFLKWVYFVMSAAYNFHPFSNGFDDSFEPTLYLILSIDILILDVWMIFWSLHLTKLTWTWTHKPLNACLFPIWICVYNIGVFFFLHHFLLLSAGHTEMCACEICWREAKETTQKNKHLAQTPSIRLKGNDFQSNYPFPEPFISIYL